MASHFPCSSARLQHPWVHIPRCALMPSPPIRGLFYQQRGACPSERTRLPTFWARIHGVKWVRIHFTDNHCSATCTTHRRLCHSLQPPLTHGSVGLEGRCPVKTSFMFPFFINQILQNNHHSLNAQAPNWSSHSQGCTLLSLPPTLLSHFPCPSPRTVLGGGWGRAGGRKR